MTFYKLTATNIYSDTGFIFCFYLTDYFFSHYKTLKLIDRFIIYINYVLPTLYCGSLQRKTRLWMHGFNTSMLL